ncbi:serine hydrolase domain-containing protein [Bremerella cremea]|uniref:serine hydrolase domain-containing protein n=1 Tax=Bremerella cremea TaxID=1031537 RepID=UPI0031ECB8C2
MISKRLTSAALALLVAVSASGISSAEGIGDREKMAATVEKLMQENAIPGAVVLIRKGTDQWLQAFGVADLKTGQPVTTDMAFRIGSNTKTMTGTVVLQLIQEGKLKLTDTVSKFFDNVPQGDQITIADLLAMRSGIPTYSDLKSVNRQLDQQPLKGYTTAELIQLGIEQKPLFKPGAEFNYSNTNYIMLGVIIERLTGKSLEEAFQQRIFTPLAMKHTSMPTATDWKMPSPYARGYLFGTNESTLDDLALPKDQQKLAIEGKLLPTDVTDGNPSWAWAAGGAVSTAEDLATYVEAMVAGGLLDEAWQNIRLDSFKPNNPMQPEATAYGLGIAKFGPLLGHDGSLPGYQSFMGFDPQTGITLIVLTNLQNTPSGEGAANLLTKELCKQIYGAPID